MFGVVSAMAFIVGGSLANLGMCFVSVVRYAILADCAIYSEWKSGFNATAIIMSVNTSIASLTAVVRSIARAFSLAMACYSAGMMSTPELKAGLVNGCVLIPLILTVISFVLTFFYKLTKEKVDEYSKDIATRAVAE